MQGVSRQTATFGRHLLHFQVENNGVQLRSILNSSHPFFQAISETFFYLGSAQSLFERNFHKAVFLSHVFGESLNASLPQSRGCFCRGFTHVETSGRLPCSTCVQANSTCANVRTWPGRSQQNKAGDRVYPGSVRKNRRNTCGAGRPPLTSLLVACNTKVSELECWWLQGSVAPPRAPTSSLNSAALPPAVKPMTAVVGCAAPGFPLPPTGQNLQFGLHQRNVNHREEANKIVRENMFDTISHVLADTPRALKTALPESKSKVHSAKMWRCPRRCVATWPQYKFVDLFTVLNMWKYVEILNISASSTNNAGQTTLCNRRRRSWTPASVLCLAYHGAGDYMVLADLCDSRMRPMLFDLELCLRLCLSICANQNQPNGPPTACSAWAAESFGTVLAARCSALRMKLCREDYTITRLFSQLNGTIQRLGPALLREVSHFCQLF